MRRSTTGDPLDGINLLGLVPVRKAGWKEEGGRVVIERPKPEGSGLRGFGSRLAYLMAAPRLRLDEFGSFAWVRFDGRTSVSVVSSAMREHFGDTAEPVEERLGTFVRLLRRERMLGYSGYDA
jgi:hypothetical protein